MKAKPLTDGRAECYRAQRDQYRDAWQDAIRTLDTLWYMLGHAGLAPHAAAFLAQRMPELRRLPIREVPR